MARDFDQTKVASTGACGLSIESILRCLVLKQTTPLSDHKLAFHLCDSPTYRTFARLKAGQLPSKSARQATVRRIQPDTLSQILRLLMSDWLAQDEGSLDALRIDSTVVDSNIAPPLDSGLLEDGVRVLSRLMANSRSCTGVQGLLLRIIDQTQRRVFYGESVPASEKLVSLFEPHTDIIAKSSRKIQYGHKVNLATEQR